MIKEYNNFKLTYQSITEMELIVKRLEEIQEINSKFWDKRKLNKKIKITFWNDIIKYKSNYHDNWINRDKDNIDIIDYNLITGYYEYQYLSIEQYINEIKILVSKIWMEQSNKTISYKWIENGIACYICKKYKINNNKIIVSIKDLLNDLVGEEDSFKLIHYILNKYERLYLDKLIVDKEFVKQEIERIYDEVNNYERY